MLKLCCTLRPKKKQDLDAVQLNKFHMKFLKEIWSLSCSAQDALILKLQSSLLLSFILWFYSILPFVHAKQHASCYTPFPNALLKISSKCRHSSSSRGCRFKALMLGKKWSCTFAPSVLPVNNFLRTGPVEKWHKVRFFFTTYFC